MKKTTPSKTTATLVKQLEEFKQLSKEYVAVLNNLIKATKTLK